MLRTHHRLPMHDSHSPDAQEDGGLSPEQLLSGIAILVGFALATGLVYALIDAWLSV
ncbi:hypothetical protein [Pigmentiphaga aceris]|uniref:hypothetical protein n=1 Tax=Pigmentiphaga aceris TaxID=1940612 RepID=UPI0016523501|nr:hypothetical protein [Pigmentiphaga aceris]